MHMKQLKSTNVYFCIKIFRNQKFFIDYKHNKTHTMIIKQDHGLPKALLAC